MTRTLKLTQTGLAIVALLGLFVVVGCSSKTEKNETPKQPQQQAPVDKTAQIQNSNDPLATVQQKMVGLWYGRAAMAEEQARQAIESQTDNAVRNRMLAGAQLFLSTEMALQLSADGTMEQQVEVVIEGKPQQMSGTGTWRVLEQHDNNVVAVELVENAADGTSTTTKRLFQLDANAQSLLMPAPVVDELTEFNPVLVFNRVPDLPDSHTAESPTNQAMQR